jgi:LysM repeat protein
VIYDWADDMDGNERLLSRVLEERRAHARLRGPGQSWLLLGSIVVAVVAVSAFVRLLGSTGVGGVPAPRSQGVATAAAPAMGRAPASVTEGAQPAAATVVAATVPGGMPSRYVVQPGDSLESIAARAGLSPTTLASVNQLDDPDLLQPGHELEIPATDGVLHIVAPGETLRSIAADYNVDLNALVAANNLSDPDHIVPGLRLFIPGGRDPLTAQNN